MLIFFSRGVGKKKEALFAPLTDLAKSMGEHKCKVLELGGGSGANFAFVKAPVEWTVTEPNVKFAPYFKETVKESGNKHKVNDLVEVPKIQHDTINKNKKSHKKKQNKNNLTLTSSSLNCGRMIGGGRGLGPIRV